MKMKSVLVSMLALAAVFSSCSKDGETPGQGGPGAITGDTYLSVALGGSRSARTYAANTAAGTVAESTVKSGYILTFNAQRQKLAATPLDLTKDIVLDPANQTLPGQPSGNTGNISAGEAIKVSDATKYVMIVLNPTPALEKTLKTATSFAELKDKVDSLVIIPNERLKHATDQKITFANAFEIADDVLRQAVQSISDLIRDTGFINLDFADVTAIMKNAGMAHMGVGRAAGKGKAEEAAKMAISSPLLETSIEGAKGVLINVTGSMDIGLEEVEQAASLVQAAVHPDALTIFGATFDETLDDEIRVTVIATGFDKVPEQLPKVPPIQAGAAGQQSAAAEPMPLKEEDVPKPEEPEDDPFEDIFKIFNKRD